jgi:hypothetical protein
VSDDAGTVPPHNMLAHQKITPQKYFTRRSPTDALAERTASIYHSVLLLCGLCVKSFFTARLLELCVSALEFPFSKNENVRLYPNRTLQLS